MAATNQQSGAAPSKTTQTEGTPSRYAELLNALVDMQASPYYAIRRPTLEGAENAIVALEAALVAAEQRAQTEATANTSLLSFIADIRAAVGDDGKLMQDELIERIRALAKDAERWKAFTQSYVRVIGCAGYGSDKDPYGHPWGNYRHFGAEFWTRHPEEKRRNDPETIAMLNDYADAAIQEPKR